MFNSKIKQNLPTNVVQLASINGELADVANAVVSDYANTTNKLNSTTPFLKSYSFNVVLNDDQTEGALGLGINGLTNNRVLVTNIASDPMFGQPIPLFYKYEIDDLTIVMPVDSGRYDWLISNPLSANEQAELADMNATIHRAIMERLYFVDLNNENAAIKFNISETYVGSSKFDITVYVPNSSKVIGSLYIVYNSTGTNYKKILNSTPVFERKSWHAGNIFYGAN